MKYSLIVSLLISLGSCERNQLRLGCEGADRFVYREAKAAFLEGGFVVVETMKDSSLWGIHVPHAYCLPCSPVDLRTLKIQSDKSSIKLNYLITCGVKYGDTDRTYTYPPAPLIMIYSIKEL